MPDTTHADATAQPDTAAVAVSAAVPTHGSHRHRLIELATILGGDILIGLLTALFGHQLGRQAFKMFQGVKTATAGPQPPAAGGAASETEPATVDPAIHVPTFIPRRFTAKDEAETGMTLGTAFRYSNDRVESAEDADEIRLEKRKFRQLEKVLGYISNDLDQPERDLLSEAVGELKTSEQQTRFWLNLVLASRNKAGFLNFMRAQRIVRDAPEFSTQLGNGVAKGFERAFSRSKKSTAKKTKQLQREIRAALRRP